MTILRGKTILVLSPQHWGIMFISKHHYALELAIAGNTVYFLNPPSTGSSSAIEIRQSEQHENLFIISHGLFFPYNFKFHFRRVYRFLMKFQLERILRLLPEKVEVVWSFDLENHFPLYLFSQSTIKIFHPVDEPISRHAIAAGKGANFVLAVTSQILEKYAYLRKPSWIIEHGVSDSFFKRSLLKTNEPQRIRVGISGNFMRPDIDWPTLFKIVENSPQVIFECWGPYRLIDSNISGSTDSETAKSIEHLRSLSNVKMYGAVTTQVLSEAFMNINVFLICYNINKDQSKGTNYHKIMEYLSTGAVIVSNNVLAYKDREGLVEMSVSRDNNDDLPSVFSRVLDNLDYFNSDERKTKRREFAKIHLYRNQIALIDRLISETINSTNN